MPKIEYLEIESIRFDPATQPRASIDEGTVEEYRETLEASDPAAAPVFREVVVYLDGSTYWLADGYHRVLAHKAAGREKINAHVFKGTKRDAILHAVGANNDHGLRRSNADKRKAVVTLLSDPEWAQWSDSEIARRCKVGQPFVSSIHRELEPAPNSKLGARPRLTADGRTMNTANLGRKPETNGHTAVVEPPRPKPQTRHVEDKSADFGDDDFYQPDPEDAAAAAEMSAPAPPSSTVVFPPESLPPREPIGSSMMPREAGQDDPETEEEWIATLPLTRKLHGEPYKKFVAAARLHWRLRDARAAFKESFAAATKGLSTKNALAKRALRYLKTDNPKYWVVCPPTSEEGCDGLGKLPGIDEVCPMCWGDGFLPEPKGRRR